MTWRGLRRTLGIAALFASTAAASSAAADEPPATPATPVRVVLLGRPNASALTRMRAELETLGWQVFAPRPRAHAPGMAGSTDALAPSREELEGTAREFRATALVELDDEGALHVWVVDAAGHVQPVEVLRTPAEDVTTLRSAEVVRVAVEYRLRTHEVPGSNRPGETADRPGESPEPSASETPAPPKFRVAAGLSALAMPYGGMRPGWNLRLGASYHFQRNIGIALFAGVPLVPNTWEPKGASTDIRAWLLGVGPVFTWESKQRLWAVSAGGGIAGAVMEYSGGALNAHAHQVDRKGPMAIPFLEFGVGLRIFSESRLTLGALVGQALPRTTVSLADHDNSAVWGQPLTMLSLTLDAGF
ncbi:hypothetical protein LZC95_19115 [Pendulispora brunnea]|uniref:Outer membrane protein beta-barrel domain-containing protein n=1 Tax=Pendulispora brunnea TaxID=2905690 RepID=A0ABZ2KMU0_9BACT